MSDPRTDTDAVAIVEIVKSMSIDDLGVILNDSVKYQLLECPTMSYSELKDNMIDAIIMSIEQSDEGSRYFLNNPA